MLAVLVATAETLAQTPDRTYVNPVHRWTITYPGDWSVDSQNVAFVQLKPPASLATGLVGIHTGPVRFASADELVDVMVAVQSRSAQGVRVLSRRAVYLADSVPAIELETELGAGTVGRSRRRFIVMNGIAYVIDAETYRDSWPKVESHFARIIQSFKLERRP
jgi:hypothetical protein